VREGDSAAVSAVDSGASVTVRRRSIDRRSWPPLAAEEGVDDPPPLAATASIVGMP
jgi:hypothetical protein